jgi:hypothetical protein
MAKVLLVRRADACCSNLKMCSLYTCVTSKLTSQCGLNLDDRLYTLRCGFNHASSTLAHRLYTFAIDKIGCPTPPQKDCGKRYMTLDAGFTVVGFGERRAARQSLSG